MMNSRKEMEHLAEDCHEARSWLNVWSKARLESSCLKAFETYHRSRSHKQITSEDSNIKKVFHWLHEELKPTRNNEPVSRQVMNTLPLPYMSNLKYETMLGAGKHGVVALYKSPEHRLLAIKFLKNQANYSSNNSPRDEYDMGKLFESVGLAAPMYWFLETPHASVICQDACEQSFNDVFTCAFVQFTGSKRFEILAWLTQHILKIYEKLAEHHLAHGDLHPENVRIRWGHNKLPRMFLIDFGKSRRERPDIIYDMVHFLMSLKLYVNSVVKYRFPEKVKDMLKVVRLITESFQHKLNSFNNIKHIELSNVTKKEQVDFYNAYLKSGLATIK